MNRTVFGVPLEEGERVVYYRREEPGWQRPVLIIVGLLFSFTVVGLFLLVAGIMATTQVHAVTTRRFLVITRKKTEEMRFDDVVKVTKLIKRGRLQWIELDRLPGKGYMWLQAQVVPDLVPLIDRFARDRRTFDAMPEVAFDVDTAALPVRTKGA